MGAGLPDEEEEMTSSHIRSTNSDRVLGPEAAEYINKRFNNQFEQFWNFQKTIMNFWVDSSKIFMPWLHK